MNEAPALDPAARPDARSAARAPAEAAQLPLRAKGLHAYVAFAILARVFSLASPGSSPRQFPENRTADGRWSRSSRWETFVIIARQIDLSGGSTLALSGMCGGAGDAHIDNSWLVERSRDRHGGMVGLVNAC